MTHCAAPLESTVTHTQSKRENRERERERERKRERERERERERKGPHCTIVGRFHHVTQIDAVRLYTPAVLYKSTGMIV